MANFWFEFLSLQIMIDSKCQNVLNVIHLSGVRLNVVFLIHYKYWDNEKDFDYFEPHPIKTSRKTIPPAHSSKVRFM